MGWLLSSYLLVSPKPTTLEDEWASWVQSLDGPYSQYRTIFLSGFQNPIYNHDATQSFKNLFGLSVYPFSCATINTLAAAVLIYSKFLKCSKLLLDQNPKYCFIATLVTHNNHNLLLGKLSSHYSGFQKGPINTLHDRPANYKPKQ